LQYNQQGLDDRFYRMAQQMHLKDGEDIPKALLDFNHRLNLPVNLSQCGIKVENLPELTELAVADFCLPLNPRPAGYQDILSIYQKALG
jgi:alcohol dehydrogenase class IV